MTTPFDSQFIFNDEQTDGAGTTGNAGGGIRNIPIPTPTAVPTGPTNTCVPECPAGYFCQPTFSDNLGQGFGVGISVTYNCVQFIFPTPTPTPVPPYCNMKNEYSQCATLLGNNWIGEATRTVNVLVNGSPTPDGCTSYPGIPSDWDTGECTQVIVAPYCNMKNEYAQCSTLLGSTWTGEATRTVNVLVNGSPTPAGCTPYPGIPSDWDTGECIQTIVCPPPDEFLRCEDGYARGRTRTNAVFSTGVLQNGVCGEYRGNSAECEVVVICDPLPPYFAGCDGTTGLYLNGCNDRFTPPIPPERRVNDPTCVVTPTPVPLGPTPIPTQVVPTPIPTQVVPTPTPTLPVPTPTPTPVRLTPSSVVKWRDCISGELFTGTPSDRREVTYSGPGGGTCWEPVTIVTFNPSLNDELLFQYQQGSTQYPTAKIITATNSSTALSYELQITTNIDITVTPSVFIIPPRSNVSFTVQVTPKLLNELATGTSTLRMSVGIREL